MKKRSKKYKAFEVDREKKYSVAEALDLITKHPMTRFDESIDVAVVLSVDTQQSNQQVRGTVSLPHGLGKPVKVLVFAKGEKEQQAKEAGADFVGSEDLVEKIQGGWFDFDRVIATPDQMPVVSKVASILGPRGKMPNPKLGTVTSKPHEAVVLEKKGKASFRAMKAGKAGLIHSSIGRQSLGSEKLKENFSAFMQSLIKAKPATSKGNYLRSISLSSTMGPGLSVDISDSQAVASEQ